MILLETELNSWIALGFLPVSIWGFPFSVFLSFFSFSSKVSLYRPFSSLTKCIPRYFIIIIWAMANGIAFLISFSVWLPLVCQVCIGCVSLLMESRLSYIDPYHLHSGFFDLFSPLFHLLLLLLKYPALRGVPVNSADSWSCSWSQEKWFNEVSPQLACIGSELVMDSLYYVGRWSLHS